jgi:hypothetical protein
MKDNTPRSFLVKFTLSSGEIFTEIRKDKNSVFDLMNAIQKELENKVFYYGYQGLTNKDGADTFNLIAVSQIASIEIK